MAAQAETRHGQVLVNKQFNSPIKLYSPQNVAEVLNKQTQVLENGAVGIDFHQLSAPGHLANSAVLRMLAEEERQRGGAPKEESPPPLTPAAAEPSAADAPGPGPAPAAERAAAARPAAPADDPTRRRPLRLRWTPLEYGIAQGYNNVVLKHPLLSSSRFPVSQGLKRVAWPPPPESEGSFIESQPVFSKGAGLEASFAPPSPRQAPPAWQPPAAVPVQAPLQAPVQAPLQAPAPFAPVRAPPAPAPAPAPQFQTSPAAGQVGQPQLPPLCPPSYQFPSYQAPAFEPPPATVLLRPEAPVSQEPFPVFESQPAATRAAEPTMRGDEKWPPVQYKARAAAENEQRVALARGPAVRPRKVNRDYSKFFAQHALTANYPSYKAPPGTQHYVEEGTSNF